MQILAHWLKVVMVEFPNLGYYVVVIICKMCLPCEDEIKTLRSLWEQWR